MTIGGRDLGIREDLDREVPPPALFSFFRSVNPGVSISVICISLLPLLFFYGWTWDCRFFLVGDLTVFEKKEDSIVGCGDNYIWIEGVMV